MALHNKASKEESNYRPSNNVDRRCGLCSMFQAPHSCTAVKGDISAGDVCDYFKRKPKAKGKLYQ